MTGHPLPSLAANAQGSHATVVHTRELQLASLQLHCPEAQSSPVAQGDAGPPVHISVVVLQAPLFGHTELPSHPQVPAAGPAVSNVGLLGSLRTHAALVVGPLAHSPLSLQ